MIMRSMLSRAMLSRAMLSQAMLSRVIGLAGAIAFALAPTAHAAGPTLPSDAANGAWLAHVVTTSDGSHLIGNPNASIKIVEYMSYTCPHCAHFEAEGVPQLRLTVLNSGKASLEIRHFLRDPVDTAAALLTNCGPANRFFVMHDMFLREQHKWLEQASKMAPSQQKRWFNGPMPTRMRAIASDLGFYQMVEARGMSRITADRCLANEALMKKLAEQTARANIPGFEGTPAFSINGLLLAGTSTWNSLKPQIEARM